MDEDRTAYEGGRYGSAGHRRTRQYHEEHGEYPSGVECLRQLPPESSIDEGRQEVDGWRYLPTAMPAGFTLSNSLGWDPALEYRWDGVVGIWVLVPGDGSDEKVIRLDP